MRSTQVSALAAFGCSCIRLEGQKDGRQAVDTHGRAKPPALTKPEGETLDRVAGEKGHRSYSNTANV